MIDEKKKLLEKLKKDQEVIKRILEKKGMQYQTINDQKKSSK